MSSLMASMIDEFGERSVTARVLDGAGAQYRNGRPLYNGESTPCFDDGLLFRIVEESTGRWSFYNDSTNSEMHVEFTFGKNSEIKALGDTKITENDDDEYVASVVVYPLETELFIEGDVNGYTSNIRAVPLTEDYLKDMASQDYERVKEETLAVYNLLGGKIDTDEAIRACMARRVKFVDLTFPPEQESLQIGALLKLKVLPWERPSMYLSDDLQKQARLFRNGVHPNNIDEGDLGDSWLLGAVAALAEFPDKIRDMFRHPESVEAGQQEREYGIYRVTFNKNGWWTNVVVDDYLPVAGGRPKFGRSKGDTAELWVTILEKAYAKLHGGYGFIIAGDPLHALQDISGYPCSSFDNAFLESTQMDTFELFGHLFQYCQNGYQIIFTTPTRDSIVTSRIGMTATSFEQAETGYDESGILLGHTYGVLNIVTFPDMDLRLLQLRNPWSRTGKSDWGGAWNKSDPNWEKYPEVREACRFTPEDDGTFYMEWSDVQDYFVGCGVCFIQHPVYDYRIRGAFLSNVPTTCLEISVAEATILNLMLFQEDKRGTEKPEYAPIMISVAHGAGAMSPMRVDLNSSFDIDHPSGEYTFLQSREVSMFYEFLPECSPYLIVPRAMNRDLASPDLPYTLGILSPVEIGTQASTVRVAFRAVAPENRIFDNYPRFNADTMPCETEFQAKGPDQFFPDIYVGTIIQTE